jgi:Rrf2 family protein
MCGKIPNLFGLSALTEAKCSLFITHGCKDKHIVITQTGQYALQALIYLAHQPNNGYSLCRDIGHDLGIPEPYLSKILHLLARKGLLESQKGRHGGFRLGVSADEISLFAVIEPLEDMERYYRCLLGPGTCTDEDPCPLHHVWQDVRDKYLASLKSTTIAQVARFK